MKNIIKVFVFLTFIIGGLYPLATTLIGKTLFNHQVNGSILIKDGKVVGSTLIAQEFKSPKYFFPRPSAVNYDPMNSGASNYGPISKKFKDELDKRIADGFADDMLFTSGSGLDPHISPASAMRQIDRVIKARNLTEIDRLKLISLVEKHTLKKTWGILGNDLVNVLELNLDLDKGLN